MKTAVAFARYWAVGILACALALLGGVTLMSSPARASGICAQGSTPCIELQRNFSYPDETTFIGGPAGTQVNVIGGGFGAALDGKTISLGVVKGEDILGVDPNPTLCSHAHVNTGVTAVIGANGTSGSFTASFNWPTGTSEGNWSICAYLAGTNTPAAGGNTDNAAFYSSSPYVPKVSVSPTTVEPGGSVTVTGAGWLPAENSIVVYIAPCKGCTPIARYGNAASADSGCFRVPLTIPANTKLGKYLVWAGSSAIPVSTSSSGPHLMVGSAAPAPTATPKPTVTTTPIPTTTPLPETTATARSVLAVDDKHQTGSGGGPALYLGLGGLLALAALAGGLIYLIRRWRVAMGSAATSTPQNIPQATSGDLTEPDMLTL